MTALNYVIEIFIETASNVILKTDFPLVISGEWF